MDQAIPAGGEPPESATAGRRGLPELFARLWRSYGARERPIDQAVIRREAELIAGRPLAGYFRRFIEGTTELPVPRLLRRAGVKVEAKAPGDANDRVKSRRLLPWSGLVFATNGESERAVVKNVVPGSPAFRAGLTFADELIAVDGVRVNGTSVGKRLADRAPGQQAEVAFFRRDRLHTATVHLVRNPERKWCFALDLEAGAAVAALRRQWLGTRS